MKVIRTVKFTLYLAIEQINTKRIVPPTLSSTRTQINWKLSNIQFRDLEYKTSNLKSIPFTD